VQESSSSNASDFNYMLNITQRFTELREAVSSAQSTSFESVLKRSGQEEWSYTKLILKELVTRNFVFYVRTSARCGQ
jgi:hypothetical protein